jgi:predicted MFS family arabinose efflux permease
VSTEGSHRQHYNITFALLAIAGVSYALLQSLVAPALPDIQHSLHTSENSVSWILTSYLLSASVATPLIGRLGDMYGKERLLMIVLALLSVGAAVSAVSSSLPLMLVGRVIQGAAGEASQTLSRIRFEQMGAAIDGVHRLALPGSLGCSLVAV